MRDLTQTLCDVVPQEGNTLNKGLFGIQAVVDSLISIEESSSGGGGGAITPYSQSMMTQVLSDALGGNCFTMTIGSCVGDDDKGSRATLGLLSALQRTRCYPVRNGIRERGLIRRLRGQQEQLQDEIRRLQGTQHGFQQQREEREVQDHKLHTLEEQKIKSDLERLSLKDEREKMRAQLKTFKEKCVRLRL